MWWLSELHYSMSAHKSSSTRSSPFALYRIVQGCLRNWRCAFTALVHWRWLEAWMPMTKIPVSDSTFLSYNSTSVGGIATVAGWRPLSGMVDGHQSALYCVRVACVHCMYAFYCQSHLVWNTGKFCVVIFTTVEDHGIRCSLCPVLHPH